MASAVARLFILFIAGSTAAVGHWGLYMPMLCI